MTKYFSYSAEGGFSFHSTEEDAQAAAAVEIGAERENANEGWGEDVEDICWGQVKEKAVQVDAGPAHPFMKKGRDSWITFWKIRPPNEVMRHE